MTHLADIALTQEQIAIIKAYKHSIPGSPNSLRIPIRNARGINLGHLSPITVSSAEDPDVIEALTRWRDRYKAFFQSQFKPTLAGTQSWLKNVVLKNDSRLLFLIYANSGVRVGNFGICHLTSTQAELDNLLRGEKGGDPDLIYHAEICMIHWIYETLCVGHIFLLIFENNILTIMLHRSIGFKEIRSHPLYRVEKGEELNYTTIYEEGATPIKRKMLEMAIDKKKYYEKHPWVQAQGF